MPLAVRVALVAPRLKFGGVGTPVPKNQSDGLSEIEGATRKEVEPTVFLLPSAFEMVAVRMALPTVRPLTTTGVVLLKVPVGVTMVAALE
ncbi:MAG: hypothetical protein WCE61_16240, partial [Candidatus Acidiferrum sp.]